MSGNSTQSGNGGYAVKHNPWPLFVDEPQTLCNVFDTPETGFAVAVGTHCPMPAC